MGLSLCAYVKLGLNCWRRGRNYYWKYMVSCVLRPMNWSSPLLRALFVDGLPWMCVYSVIRQERRKEQTNDDEAATDHTSRHATSLRRCRVQLNHTMMHLLIRLLGEDIYVIIRSVHAAAGFTLYFIACKGAAWLRGRGRGHIWVSELNIRNSKSADEKHAEGPCTSVLRAVTSTESSKRWAPSWEDQQPRHYVFKSKTSPGVSIQRVTISVVEALVSAAHKRNTDNFVRSHSTDRRHLYISRDI